MRSEAMTRTGEHLGRHIRRRPCDIRRGLDVGPASARIGLECEGEAPIRHVHFAKLTDHHVLGLEIAMDEAARMREMNGLADLDEDAEVPLQQIVDLEATLGMEGVMKIGTPMLSFDPFEGDTWNAISVDLERARNPRLLEELLDVMWLIGLGAERLDRDLAPEPSLLCQKDPAHATFAEHIEEHETFLAALQVALQLLQPPLAAGGWAGCDRRAEVRAHGPITDGEFPRQLLDGGLDRIDVEEGDLRSFHASAPYAVGPLREGQGLHDSTPRTGDR